MNQKVLIAIVVLVLLGGAGYMVMSKKGGTPGTSSPSTTGGNVFTSIKDALSKSLSLECTFTDEGGRQTKSFIKNGAVRADITAKDPKESGSVIVKSKTMYFWNGKTGFMMQIPEETGAPAQAGTKGSEPENANIMESMEKFKDSCKPAVVADSLFTPPTDVTFQDFSKMMQPPAAGSGTNVVPSIDYSKYLPTGEPPASE